MDNAILYSKLVTLPENLKLEVEDFIDFLLSKAKRDEKNTAIPNAKFGSAKGVFKMKSDFDQPLEDFKDYMS